MLRKIQVSFSPTHWHAHGGETRGFWVFFIVLQASRVRSRYFEDDVKCDTEVNEMGFGFARAEYLLSHTQEEATNASWMKTYASGLRVVSESGTRKSRWAVWLW